MRKKKNKFRQTNPYAKELHTPKYKTRVVQDKRQKKERYKNDYRQCNDD